MITIQDKQAIAHSSLLPKIIEFLNECKNPIPSIIGEDQFQTTVNAVTMERQAELIYRFSSQLEDVKQHKINE